MYLCKIYQIVGGRRGYVARKIIVAGELSGSSQFSAHTYVCEHSVNLSI